MKEDKARLEVKECPHMTTSEVQPGWTWCPDCWLMQGPPNEKAKYQVVTHPRIFDTLKKMSSDQRRSFFELAEKLAENPRIGIPLDTIKG